MGATSSILLKGTVTCATSKSSQTMALLQAVGAVEVKGPYEYTIPAGTVAPVTIPLPFSNGVEEALILILNTSRPVILEITTTDTHNSQATEGPIRIGAKGVQMWTCTPGEGIATLKAANLDLDEDVVVEVIVAAVQAPSDTPPFWED